MSYGMFAGSHTAGWDAELCQMSSAVVQGFSFGRGGILGRVTYGGFAVLGGRG